MKKITACAIVAACTLAPVTAFAATQWTVNWSAPQAISTAPAPGGGIENGGLAASSDGTHAVAVWAQYQGSSEYRVWSARTDDAGATWSAPDPRSSTTVNAEFPDVVMSDDGSRATMIWYASSGSTLVRTASSTDGGDTWTPKTVAGPISASRNPELAGSADGTQLVALWGEFNTNDVLRVARSSDGGSNWSTAADLSDPLTSADDPAIALSADGLRAVAAYVQDDGSNGRVRVRTSSDGGATWNPAVTLSDAGQNAGQPQIALSDDGTKVAVTWVRSDGLNSRVQVRRSDDAGVNWSPSETLSASGQDANGASVAASADGTDLTIAWQITGVSEHRIQSRSTSDGGLTWSPAATHSAEASTGDDPDVAVSADGTTAAISWYRIIDFNPSRVEAATSADSGMTWSSAQTLSDPGFDADGPRIAMSGNGRRLITTWIGADATDRLTRAAAGTLRTVPGTPSVPNASPGNAQLDATWSPPADDGGSPVTSYTATASPGGQTCTTPTTSCTISGLANGTAYTVTVTATNAIGTGPASAASAAVVPSAPPAPAPPAPPAPPPADLDDSDPPTTKVIAKANDAKSKLKVKIKPDLGKKKQWEFVVKVKKKGDWKTIKTKKDKTKVYETEGPDHTLTIDLDEGKYKAKSKEARGHSADTSDVVKLKK